jgi:hypothetical protein
MTLVHDERVDQGYGEGWAAELDALMQRIGKRLGAWRRRLGPAPLCKGR